MVQHTDQPTGMANSLANGNTASSIQSLEKSSAGRVITGIPVPGLIDHQSQWNLCVKIKLVGGRAKMKIVEKTITTIAIVLNVMAQSLTGLIMILIPKRVGPIASSI